MGLSKRGRVWWMNFTFQGKQIRRSTETSDRKIAQRILDKVKGEVAEGKWFERLPGQENSIQPGRGRRSIQEYGEVCNESL